jgi:hypothetical protein
MTVRFAGRMRGVAMGATAAAVVVVGALVAPSATAAPLPQLPGAEQTEPAPEQEATGEESKKESEGTDSSGDDSEGTGSEGTDSEGTDSEGTDSGEDSEGTDDDDASTQSGDYAPADSAAIRPGVVTETVGGGACTSNFIFTVDDRTFIGQAAHCAGLGEATDVNGCDTESLPLGTPVNIQARDGSTRAGTLAYSSWLTMQAVDEQNENICQFNDFALIEIAPEDEPDVNPTFPIFGGPTGVDSDGLPAGEEVFSYGNSPLRGGFEELSPKVGVSAGDVGEGYGHEVFTITPGIPGDSGSGFLDADGEAVGVLSTLNLAPLPASNGIADVFLAIQYAQDNAEGFGDLQLVEGTEPFNPTPFGVPLTAVAPPAGPPVEGA